jgi:hypothetical protein
MRIGRKTESENDRWLLARIAAPSAGMLRRPTIHGRKIAFTIGPMMMYLKIQ